MKRPSFQFYPSDWTGNSKLRMCKAAHKGAWLDVLCLMHDSDEYGILRTRLADIAQGAGHPVKLLRDLIEKGILKGGDDGTIEAFVYRPRHAGKDGEPVTLIPAQAGPLWYSSRMVRDEYIRTKRGEGTRFGDAPKPPPIKQPTPRQGDGPSSSSSTSSSGVISNSSAALDVPTRVAALAAALRDKGVNVNPETLLVREWLDRGVTQAQALAAVAVARQRKPEPEPIPAAYLEAILSDKKNGHSGPEKPWFIRSATAIEAKGRELGVEPVTDEPFPYFKLRVFKAAGVTDDMVRKAEAEYR